MISFCCKAGHFCICSIFQKVSHKAFEILSLTTYWHSYQLSQGDPDLLGLVDYQLFEGPTSDRKIFCTEYLKKRYKIMSLKLIGLIFFGLILSDAIAAEE